MSFELLNGVQNLAIVCTQWGDTGKGKFVDLFAEWADVIVRGIGGANSGRTVCRGEWEFIFHLLPSGLSWDGAGKVNVIGRGVALDPSAAIAELDQAQAAGLTANNLKIAYNAKLVLPQHILLDRVKEKKAGDGRIGTTGRGMGPVHVDHYARIGLVVNDLLNPNVFVRKLRRNLEDKLGYLRQADPEVVREILHHPDLGGGAYYHPENILDVDNIVTRYRAYGERLRQYITDTDAFLQLTLTSKKRILLEGAHGNLLSVERGTYPYVTSSDCSVGGLARGAGLSDKDVDLALGIMKAFYITRVGGGPFPTELGGARSNQWCNDPQTTRQVEEERFPNANVNSADEFEQGIGIRRAGREYGATTGRPRRTGWFDLPLQRYSQTFTGENVILTKLDVLDDCEQIKVCTSYRYCGPEYRLGSRLLQTGDLLDVAVPDSEVLRHCEPIYQELPGWQKKIREIRAYSDLPLELRTAIRFICKESRTNPVIVSVGADRDQTILVNGQVRSI